MLFSTLSCPVPSFEKWIDMESTSIHKWLDLAICGYMQPVTLTSISR